MLCRSRLRWALTAPPEATALAAALSSSRRDAEARSWTPAARLELLIDAFDQGRVGPRYHVIAARSVASLRSASVNFYESVQCQMTLLRAIVNTANDAPPFDDHSVSRLLSFAVSPYPGSAAYDTVQIAPQLARERILLQLMLLARKDQCPTLHLAIAFANFANVSRTSSASIQSHIDEFSGVPRGMQDAPWMKLIKSAGLTAQDCGCDEFTNALLEAWFAQRRQRARDIVDTAIGVTEVSELLRGLSAVKAAGPHVFPTLCGKFDDVISDLAAYVRVFSGPLRIVRDLSYNVVSTVMGEAFRDEGPLSTRATVHPFALDSIARSVRSLINLNVLPQLTEKVRARLIEHREKYGNEDMFNEFKNPEFKRTFELITDLRNLANWNATMAHGGLAAAEHRRPVALSTTLEMAGDFQKMKNECLDASHLLSAVVRAARIGHEGGRLTVEAAASVSFEKKDTTRNSAAYHLAAADAIKQLKGKVIDPEDETTQPDNATSRALTKEDYKLQAKRAARRKKSLEDPLAHVLQMRNQIFGSGNTIHQCRYDLIGLLPPKERHMVVSNASDELASRELQAEVDSKRRAAQTKGEGGDDAAGDDGDDDTDAAKQPARKDLLRGFTPSKTSRTNYMPPASVLQVVVGAVHKRVTEVRATTQKDGYVSRRADLWTAQAEVNPNICSWDDEEAGETAAAAAAAGTRPSAPPGRDDRSSAVDKHGLAATMSGNQEYSVPLEYDERLFRELTRYIDHSMPVTKSASSAQYSWLRLIASVASDGEFVSRLAKMKVVSLALAIEVFIRHECTMRRRHVRNGIADSFSFVAGAVEAMSRLPPMPEIAEVVRRCAHVMMVAARETVIVPSATGVRVAAPSSRKPGARGAAAAADDALSAVADVSTGSTSPATRIHRQITEPLQQRTPEIGALRVITQCLSALARSHYNRRADVDLTHALPVSQLEDIMRYAEDLLVYVRDARSVGYVLFSLGRLGVKYRDVRALVRNCLSVLRLPPAKLASGARFGATTHALPEEVELSGQRRDFLTLGEVCGITDALNILQCDDKWVVDRIVKMHGKPALVSADTIAEIAEAQNLEFGEMFEAAKTAEVRTIDVQAALMHSFDLNSVRVPCGIISPAQLTRLRRLVRRSVIGHGDNLEDPVVNSLVGDKLRGLHLVKSCLFTPYVVVRVGDDGAEVQIARDAFAKTKTNDEVMRSVNAGQPTVLSSDQLGDRHLALAGNRDLADSSDASSGPAAAGGSSPDEDAHDLSAVVQIIERKHYSNAKKSELRTAAIERARSQAKLQTQWLPAESMLDARRKAAEDTARELRSREFDMVVMHTGLGGKVTLVKAKPKRGPHKTLPSQERQKRWVDTQNPDETPSVPRMAQVGATNRAMAQFESQLAAGGSGGDASSSSSGSRVVAEPQSEVVAPDAKPRVLARRRKRSAAADDDE